MTQERVLVVGPSWVGDMVMAQSLFKLLRERRDVVIDVLAPRWSLPVIARMPEVRRGIALEVGHGELALGERRKLGTRLRDLDYTQAIVLPRSLKSALVPWFAQIPRRTGFRSEMRFGLINDMRTLDRRVLDQTVKRFVTLGTDDASIPEHVPIPSLTPDAEKQQALVSQLQLDIERPVVALMPGAEYGPAKCWPISHFSALSRLLGENGHSTWIIGSANDHAAGLAIASNSPARNLCGETSLEDVVDLLALCRHAVSNDSGLLHIAAAVGITVHAIYGSSSPLFTPPLTERKYIHYLDLDCSPCFKRECPLIHLNCLKQIRPENVLSNIVN